MKRFICALLLLTMTITSAAFINIKAINVADEMIEIINSDCEQDKIAERWNKKKILFEIVLTQTKVDSLDNLIKDNDRINTVKQLQQVKESLKLNINNVL